jgi:hypothetical protein
VKSTKHVAKWKAEAAELGLRYGDIHPTTGMVWGLTQWHSQTAFEKGRRGQLLRNARWRAKAFNREFDLTHADFNRMWPADGRCPVFPHIVLQWGRSTDIANSPSIDRIDSSRGYSPDNCRIISHRANMLKSNATDDEVILMAADVMRRKQHDSAE